MKPVNLKDLKKGQVFYERGSADWYSLTALEDAYYKGDILIDSKIYKQYTVKSQTEFGEIIYIMITEGLSHYSGKYFIYGND